MRQEQLLAGGFQLHSIEERNLVTAVGRSISPFAALPLFLAVRRPLSDSGRDFDACSVRRVALDVRVRSIQFWKRNTLGPSTRRGVNLKLARVSVRSLS